MVFTTRRKLIMAKAGKSEFKNKLDKMEQIRRQIEKESKKIVVECSHQNEKGKLKIHPINDRGDFECKYCKSRFNMNQIHRDTIDEAINVLHNVIQQTRCFSDIEEDDKIIRLLGELDYNLQETGELYERVRAAYGRNGGNKKKKKKHDSGDNFGSYAGGNLSFLGGNRRR